jgi:tetratricopeptide (TPR) repeat protein
MAAIDPPTADMAEDDPSAPRSTRFDWDKIATEEAAKLEREEKEEAEAEAEKRSSSKNVDASARDPPRSAAEAEERRKRDALREAKDAWRAKDAADLAAKHIVGEGLVATQVSITSADLGKDKNAVHIKGARDCVFTIDPNVRCAKLFIEDCTRCEVKVDGLIVTQSAEVWNCVDCSMAVMTQLCTIQVDGCAGQRLRFNKTEFFGAVVHATCVDKLLLQFEHIVSQLCLVEAEASANERHLASVSADPGSNPGEIAQFITRIVNGAILTERVVRGKDEFPTTAREMLVARNEAALAGDLSAKASIETSGDAKIDADTAADRAETRKDKGNEAFKEGNYPQAAVFYTQCLELAPTHHVALANRAACFLKMGEHGKALDDSIKCAEVEPEYVKGHFRKGLSLHALGRYGEAVCSLEIAERLDPRNKQVVEALKMAAFKARQQPRD